MRRTASIALVAFAAFAAPAWAYHHPTLGRFVQRDPAGCVDGMNLQEYGYSDPVTRSDWQGTWAIKREGKPTALAIADKPFDLLERLALDIGLNVEEWQQWLQPADPTDRTSYSIRPAYGGPPAGYYKVCGRFKVPNTVLALWAGAGGRLGKWWVMWASDVRTLKRRGFHVEEQDYGAPWPYAGEPSLLKFLKARGLPSPAKAFNAQGQYFKLYAKWGTLKKELHGIYYWGHGGFARPAAKNPLKGRPEDGAWMETGVELKYRLGLGILWGCDMGMYGPHGQYPMFTSRAITRFGGACLIPHGLHLYGPTVASLVKPGAQGTRR